MELGERIARHRRALGLTGEQLGSLAGISKSQVSRIESGRRQPGLTDLAYMAKAFGTTVDSLLGVEPTGSVALTARVLEAELGELDKTPPMRRRMVQLLDLYSVLVTATGLGRAPLSIPGEKVLDNVPENAQGDEVAGIARDILGLGRAPISDVMLLAEEHFGVDVVGWPSNGSIDGLLARSEGVAILLANTATTEGQARFTVAYELAHHVFADPRPVIAETINSDSTIETRASRFAGALLLPGDGVREVVADRGVNEDSITDLVRIYRVGYTATIIRLHELKMITRSERHHWLSLVPVEVLRNGGDPNPLELVRPMATEEAMRLPKRLWRHAQTAYVEGRTSLGVLAGLADENPDELFVRLNDVGVRPPAFEDDLAGL